VEVDPQAVAVALAYRTYFTHEQKNAAARLSAAKKSYLRSKFGYRMDGRANGLVNADVGFGRHGIKPENAAALIRASDQRPAAGRRK
jgi:hypothetical protein